MSIQSLEAMTGMKSGKKKTHRGKRGGKSHNKPKHSAPKAPAVPPEALAALLAGGAPGAGPVPGGPPMMAGAPPQAGGADPAVAHLIAALSALHGGAAGAPPQGLPPQIG